MKKRPIKLGLVCTPGGHFEQMLNLSELYGRYPHFWITAKNAQTVSQLEGETVYYINNAHFKHPMTYVRQMPNLLGMFRTERPTHVLSTGSGRIVLFPFVLSVPFRAKFIHIDTFSHVANLTKMGALLSRLGYPVLTQWDGGDKAKTEYIGPVFRDEAAPPKRPGSGDYVFVTLGTRFEPFARMPAAVEKLVRDGVIKEKVIVQAGHTKVDPGATDVMEIFDFCSPARIDDLILNAKYVITQESAGIVTKCLKFRAPFMVMPRDYALGELPTESDMREDLHLKLAELGYTHVVRTPEDISAAIGRLGGLKMGFTFDNSLAIRKLAEMIERRSD